MFDYRNIKACLFMIAGGFLTVLGIPKFAIKTELIRQVCLYLGLVSIFFGGRYSNLRYFNSKQPGAFGFITGCSLVFIFGASILVLVFQGSGTGILIGIMAFCALVAGAVLNAPYKRYMTGIEYEYYCADYLQRHGFYNVQVTPASNDYGADVIAYDGQGQKWVIQCKLYHGKVDNAAVQQVFTSMRHYGADRGMVITNSVLTDNAKRLAMENNISFVEGLI